MSLKIDESEKVRSEPYLSVFVTVVSPKRPFLGLILNMSFLCFVGPEEYLMINDA